ncbi:SnoaL-like domain-containing protein [Cladophialophora immunda]|nr:SnoaL-like domain-containing protein [Cladophialophora immunda]
MLFFSKATLLATAALSAVAGAWPLTSRATEAQNTMSLLAARDQISNALSDYAFFVDSKQFDNLTQVFAPNGSCYFPKPYPQMKGSAEIIEVLRNATVDVHSQHLMGSFYIDIMNMTAATSHSYYSATFLNATPADDVYHHGQYYDTWVNLGSASEMEWRITNRTLLSWD